MRKRQKEDGEQMGEVVVTGKEKRREIDMNDIPGENSGNSKCDREEHGLQKQHLYVYYFHILRSFFCYFIFNKI